MILLLNIYYADDQTKESDVGRECSTYGSEERDTQGLGEET